MSKVIDLLGKENEGLLKHTCTAIPKESLTLTGPDFVDRIFIGSDRNNNVLKNLNWMYNHGRLAGTG